MVTKEQYLDALKQHFESKKIISEFHTQIENSLNEISLKEQAEVKYSIDTNLKNLLYFKYGHPTEVFSVRTRNGIASIMESHDWTTTNPLFNDNSTIKDLINAFNSGQLNKVRNLGIKSLKEIAYFIETSVVEK